MADISSYSPQSGNIIGADNRAYNIVDLLKGGTPINNQVYDVTQYAPKGGIVIGNDGRAYDLTQLLAHAGDARVLDELPEVGKESVVYVTADGVYRYDATEGWYLVAGKAIPAYGAYYDGGSSPTLTRLGDAIGKTAAAQVGATLVANDFDLISPWSDIGLVNLANDGTIVARYGEPGFSFTGACPPYTYRVPVMVRIPKFWYKVVNRAPGREFWVSPSAQAGFSLHPAFERPDGSAADEIFIGSELGGTESVGGVNMLTSNSGDDVMCNANRAAFRTLARARGEGWEQIDFLSYNALQLLFIVEFASINSQGSIGNGLSSFRYNAADVATTATTAGNDFICANATAALFDVGQTVGIGTALGSFNVAQSRVITAKTPLENGTETAVAFDGAAVNIAVGNIIWSCAQRAGGADVLGNHSGRAAGTNTSRCQNSYRGFKGFGGNSFFFLDGINIQDREWFICKDPSKYADSEFDEGDGYISIGTAPAENGYTKSLVFCSDEPWALMPAEIGGGSATYFCDYYYQNSGVRVLVVGGSVVSGGGGGAFFWRAVWSPSDGGWYGAGRPRYRKPA